METIVIRNTFLCQRGGDFNLSNIVGPGRQFSFSRVILYPAGVSGDSYRGGHYHLLWKDGKISKYLRKKEKKLTWTEEMAKYQSIEDKK